MTSATNTTPSSQARRADKAITLALLLAQAEEALDAFTSGQADAIVDRDGRAYLMRTAQEHLRQSECRLQAVIGSIPDVITLVSRGGVIMSQSQSARRLLGYEPDELVGRRFFDLIHDNDLLIVHSAFFNVIEGFRESATTEFNHLARDGSYRLFEATIGKFREPTSVGVVFSYSPIHSSRQTAEPLIDTSFPAFLENYPTGAKAAGNPSVGTPPII